MSRDTVRPSLARALAAALLLVALPACKGDDPDPPPAPACGYHDDCGDREVCFEGRCFPTQSCIERSNCRALEVCADDRCFCEESTQRCLPACVTDEDCPADGHCLDGECQRYTFAVPGVPPASGPRAPLQAGLGWVSLDYPLGCSLAGYGSRSGPRTPYQRGLGGSDAWFDRPDVRALYLDDGEEQLVLLRIPLSWTTDFMVARTIVKVAERTGVDLTGRVLTSATHSHSEPGSYWHLLVGEGFGFFGYAEFDWEIFERLTSSFADAVVQAMEARQPARIGHAVIDDFDPDNRISRDRRDRNDNLPGYARKDDRMIVIRVDDAGGQPMAVLANFGIHGTVFGGDNPMITKDAAAGPELWLTERASARYGRPVVGFYLQGNAGDISPAGDDRDHSDEERLQLLGLRTWAVVEPVLDRIETRADVDISVQTGRVPISHEHLGYAPGAFFDRDVSCENAPAYFRYGAFQCVEGYLDDTDPATAFEDGDLACVFSVECLTGGFPVPQFMKTTLAVARIGSLALATLPGEPVTQFGRDIADRVREAIPGVTDAAILGYSMDHHFYLLNEDDWLQGGYEPSRDIWGWRLGPYLADAVARIATEVGRPVGERVWDDGNLKPMYWPATPEELEPVKPTDTEGDPAEVVVDAPARVERLEELAIEWSGGHPGVDLPRVTLERLEGDRATDVTRPGGLPYSDDGFETIVRYVGRCDRVTCLDHRWRLRWQEHRDFPLGRYRFRVDGRAQKGGAIVPYVARSRAFEVVPSSALWIQGLAVRDGRLEGNVVDRPAVRLEPAGDGQRARPSGFLLRDPEVPAELGATIAAGTALSVSGSVRAPDGSLAPLGGQIEVEVSTGSRLRLVGLDAAGQPRTEPHRKMHPTSRFSLATPALDRGPGAYLVTLTLTDPLGNAGTVTATVTR